MYRYLYIPHSTTGLVVCLILFMVIAVEASWWLRPAVKARQFVYPLTMFAFAFYFMAGALVYVANLV
jgi:hypothetical protein